MDVDNSTQNFCYFASNYNFLEQLINIWYGELISMVDIFQSQADASRKYDLILTNNEDNVNKKC